MIIVKIFVSVNIVIILIILILGIQVNFGEFGKAGVSGESDGLLESHISGESGNSG